MIRYTVRGSNSNSFILPPLPVGGHLNPIALRKAKIAYNFGLSECNKGLKKGIFRIYSFCSRDKSFGKGSKQQQVISLCKDGRKYILIYVLAYIGVLLFHLPLNGFHYGPTSILHVAVYTVHTELQWLEHL